MNTIIKGFHKVADFLRGNVKSKGVKATFHKVNYQQEVMYILKSKEINNICVLTTIDNIKLFDSDRVLKDFVAQYSCFEFANNGVVVNHTMIDSIEQKGFVMRIKKNKFIISRHYRPILLDKIESNL